MVQGSWFWVWELGFRVQGLGSGRFGVEDLYLQEHSSLHMAMCNFYPKKVKLTRQRVKSVHDLNMLTWNKHGQNTALTVLCVPGSFDSGMSCRVLGR